MGGILTLSIEVELAWGDHDTGNLDRLSPGGETERRYLSDLLSVTEETQIPISFDVVGHLFLEGCSGTHDGPHREDWFRADPGTDYRADGLFYAPDMVDEIESSTVDHEICTHTFSHVLFDEISSDVCAWELETVQGLHRDRLGEATTSLVPPRHQSPPYDILKEQGIDVVRPAMDRQAQTMVHRFAELLAGPVPLSELRMEGDMVETYCTENPTLTAAALPSGQRKAHLAFRYIPTAIRQRLHLEKLKRATKAAAEADAHLHLWCHLFDLSNPQQFAVVTDYLEWLESYARDEELNIATMDELPAYV